jgi:asparagine synthase (glutamine-hydrolysing)
MMLGVVHGGRGDELPAELRLGLERIGAVGCGELFFSAGGSSSAHRDAGVSVIAETGAPRSHQGASAIADAYRTFGCECVRHLRGRFRFLLHDARRSLLLAASSTAPPWPLVYWSDSRTTVVASTVASLLGVPQVPRALDEGYLVHLVMGLSAMPAGVTALRGVRRLCAGEALLVDAEGPRVAEVDHLVPRRHGGRSRPGRAFLEELGEAVRHASDAERPVYSLSGGLDSAALACAVPCRREVAGLSFVAPALDLAAEVPAIDSMQRAWPELSLTRLDVSTAVDLPDLGAELRDDPPLTPLALLPARVHLWSVAREAGFKTVIEGEGGDELFSMLPTPVDALRHGHLATAARQIVRSGGRRSLVEHSVLLPLLPHGVQRAWLARRHSMETHLPSFATWRADEHPLIREAMAQYLELFVHRPFSDRLSDWLSSPFVVGAAMSRRHLAARFGLDLEWPMLERGVLEVILGLHEAGAIPGGDAKPFLREALDGLVPDDVRLRSKDVGLYRAFIGRVLTSPRARAALRDGRVRRRLVDLVRFERIEAMLDGLAEGRSLGPAALWQLECVVSFAQWYEQASREYGVS